MKLEAAGLSVLPPEYLDALVRDGVGPHATDRCAVLCCAVKRPALNELIIDEVTACVEAKFFRMREEANA